MEEVLLRVLRAPPAAVAPAAKSAVLASLSAMLDAQQLPELFVNFDLGVRWRVVGRPRGASHTDPRPAPLPPSVRCVGPLL